MLQVLFLQKFTFVFRRRAGFQNKVADALSRRSNLLKILRTEIIEFEVFPDQYAYDVDFGEIWQKCSSSEHCTDFHLHQRYLVKGNLLSVPRSSLRETISFTSAVSLPIRDVTQHLPLCPSVFIGQACVNRWNDLSNVVVFFSEPRVTLRTLVCTLH